MFLIVQNKVQNRSVIYKMYEVKIFTLEYQSTIMPTQFDFGNLWMAKNFFSLKDEYFI